MGIPFPNIGEEPVRRNFEDFDERVDATNAALSELEAGLGSALPVGSIVEYGGTTAPTGWMICDGTAISRTTYADLFTAISTSFGTGDGSTTFNLPDFRGRAPYGKGTNTDNDALGESDGVAEASRTPKHLLTAAESGVPDHTHDMDTAAAGGTPPATYDMGSGRMGIRGSTAGGGSSNALWKVTNGSFDFAVGVSSVQGGAQAAADKHNHGFLVVNFIIKALASGDGSGGTSGPAGGVLSGVYPNPSFAMDMATQAELDASAATKQPLDSDLTTIAAITPGAGHVLAADGAGWISKSYAALKTAMAFVKGDVGLGNVDNTSDINKPVSTAQQTALNLKADDSAVVHDTGAEAVAGVKTFSDKIIAEGSAITGLTYVPGLSFDALFSKVGIYHASGALSIFVEDGGGAQYLALQLEPTNAIFSVPLQLNTARVEAGNYLDGSASPYTFDRTSPPYATVFTDVATGQIDITLPDPYNNIGLMFTIADHGANASVNNIVVACGDDFALGTTVEGAATYTMSADGEVIVLRAEFDSSFANANWKILSRRVP